MSATQSPQLFTPIQVGDYELKHKIVMAPLTRLRAGAKDAIPSDWAIKYYTQRASEGGLIVSEGTFIAAEHKGYDYVPGIYTPEHIAAWKKITDGVHSKGGRIFCQLWVLGRAADPAVIPVVYSAGSVEDPEPSPFKSDEVKKPLVPLQEEDMDRLVGYYEQAAKNSIEAGFDGVEIHGANGYILDQFLQTNSNDRTDQYGGSIENRTRFPLRVLNAVCAAIGPKRVGIRMSPFSEFQAMRMKEPLDTFVPWAETIAKAQPELAYVHAIEGRGFTVAEDQWYQNDTLAPIREAVVKHGKSIKFISAGGYTPQKALKHAEEFPGDLVCFGRSFISNPDLPNRVLKGYPIRKYERPTFYAQTAEGYIDYEDYAPEQQALAQDEAAPSA
ncbi:hypothetical protein L202_07823 [Cryptococcus amylolentus CBS 6039]|uniref:NADH:flavin oxidoreductase/NADH oxidase N-terminal domain-containing protein n=2 Tax=Cryptococcus amylolentus TaxID=104669 RepID=A0A1E3HCU8_9TREE|nr:hypothetical protein L202_07823 [Cryptococcus amylolentus CBS 6039]ODN73271.1 hypothetical protein L202_07823 [Cryptococcus amylolentus CBS 6039]ODN99079.1 hypothetical protein I350_07234 [Cryptococcus amylolentus CBS 6273]